MNDPAAYEALIYKFGQLLNGLASSWTGDEIAFVQDLIDHDEPGEAMSNLLAIAKTRSKQFTTEQADLITELGRAMEMPVAPVAVASIAVRAQPSVRFSTHGHRDVIDR